MSFLVKAGYLYVAGIDLILLMHSPTDICRGCFFLLALINNTDVLIVQISVGVTLYFYLFNYLFIYGTGD